MIDPRFRAVRRRLALAGGRPSHASLDALLGRADAATHGKATLLDPPLGVVPVASPIAWPGPVAFLDGVQRSQLLGHSGTMPLLGGHVAAGVRRREQRDTRGVIARDAFVVIGRAAALDTLSDLPDDIRTIEIDDDQPPHPIGDLEKARARLERARIELELAVARAYRQEFPDGWLIVDGTITASPDWSTDPRMVGVIKSHATTWFEGDDLETYLTIPAGTRSGIFIPETRHLTPIHSWGLRLWPWQGRDLMHGLVRIETAVRSDAADAADELSRWLLAERAPLADDARQDRLLYGIHDVERWLRARSA